MLPRRIDIMAMCPPIKRLNTVTEKTTLALPQMVPNNDDAYRTAFEDPGCLKMVLDWRAC